jgi:hypothetical protein
VLDLDNPWCCDRKALLPRHHTHSMNMPPASAAGVEPPPPRLRKAIPARRVSLSKALSEPSRRLRSCGVKTRNSWAGPHATRKQPPGTAPISRPNIFGRRTFASAAARALLADPRGLISPDQLILARYCDMLGPVIGVSLRMGTSTIFEASLCCRPRRMVAGLAV